jgi:hypothetical protein
MLNTLNPKLFWTIKNIKKSRFKANINGEKFAQERHLKKLTNGSSNPLHKFLPIYCAKNGFIF